MAVNQKKEKIHFIVFTNTNEIIVLDTLQNFYRQDINLIIKRTFIKKSGGQRLYSYYKNQVIDSSFKVVRNNSFLWNGIKCKIVESEFWGEIIPNKSTTSIIQLINIKDRLNMKNDIRYNMVQKDVFELIQNDLNLIDRVGTFQGFIEIKRLEKEIEKLKRK